MSSRLSRASGPSCDRRMSLSPFALRKACTGEAARQPVPARGGLHYPASRAFAPHTISGSTPCGGAGNPPTQTAPPPSQYCQTPGGCGCDCGLGAVGSGGPHATTRPQGQNWREASTHGTPSQPTWGCAGALVCCTPTLVASGPQTGPMHWCAARPP